MSKIDQEKNKIFKEIDMIEKDQAVASYGPITKPKPKTRKKRGGKKLRNTRKRKNKYLVIEYNE